MADIDDELLALAGGDSEDEGSVNESREASASPAARDAKKSSKKTGRRSRGDDSEEEEGEA